MYGYEHYTVEVAHLKHQSSSKKLKRRKQKKERRRHRRADEERRKPEAVNSRITDKISRVRCKQSDKIKCDMSGMMTIYIYIYVLECSSCYHSAKDGEM